MLLWKLMLTLRGLIQCSVKRTILVHFSDKHCALREMTLWPRQHRWIQDSRQQCPAQCPAQCTAQSTLHGVHGVQCAFGVQCNSMQLPFYHQCVTVCLSCIYCCAVQYHAADLSILIRMAAYHPMLKCYPLLFSKLRFSAVSIDQWLVFQIWAANSGLRLSATCLRTVG